MNPNLFLLSLFFYSIWNLFIRNIFRYLQRAGIMITVKDANINEKSLVLVEGVAY